MPIIPLPAGDFYAFDPYPGHIGNDLVGCEVQTEDHQEFGILAKGKIFSDSGFAIEAQSQFSG